MRRGRLKAAEIIGVAEDELHIGRRLGADGARRRVGREPPRIIVLDTSSQWTSRGRPTFESLELRQKILLSKTAPEFSHAKAESAYWAHRPCARQAGEAVLAPAYDPKRLFAPRLKCKRHKPQLCGLAAYSITSVARNRKLSGTLRPMALAVLRFTTISNLVGN